MTELLESWACAALLPGAAADPRALLAVDPDWVPATVPGTAASALLAAGRLPAEDQELLDGRDWWFQTALEATGAHVLELGGLATLADVWLDDEHLLHSENMFLGHRLDVTLTGAHRLTIRCAALDPVLAGRHPRPRWKSRLVRTQALRWYRTSLLGRMPSWSARAAAVGPWRPVTLRPCQRVEILDRTLEVSCEGPGGRVAVSLTTSGQPTTVTLRVGDHSVPLTVCSDGASGVLVLPAVERWWPAGYGEQPRYEVSAVLDGIELPLGRIGFREVTIDRAGDGFTVVVNAVPVFCRGVLWNAPDTVGFTIAGVRDDLARIRDLGSNMVRVAGWSTYQDETFWDACDELGILVWQDAMIASVEPPEAPEFIAAVLTEVRQVLTALQGRPSLAVFCGSAESHQQAAVFGLTAASLANRLLDEAIPELVSELLPALPYLPSSPSGGFPAFTPQAGVCHYFGVGAFLRPLSDGRAAGVRFASECLGFAIPPDRDGVELWFGGAAAAGHDPRWKAGVGRDGGASWDFEDVTNHYVQEIFGVDPFAVRYADPNLALDYARAAVSEAMTTVLADWRRADSPAAGGLVLTWRDAWPGAGWGLHDAAGRPKAPARALRRVLAPTAVWFAEDGLAGLRLVVAHDASSPLSARLRVRLYDDLGGLLETVQQPVEVAARGQVQLSVEELLDGFRDLTRAYRFVPGSVDVVHAELDGVGDCVFLPGGAARSRLPSVGLTAVASESIDGWQVAVSTQLFAQWVALHLPGVEADDGWFHLVPGEIRTVGLSGRPTRGSVRALNSVRGATVTFG